MTLFVLYAKLIGMLLQSPAQAVVPLIEQAPHLREVAPDCAPDRWESMPPSERVFYQDGGRLCVGVIV